ncbi:hypothetical protein [Micromonospora sp. CPCC 205561]|uniref:hypothetical protein n=1 Tax=Micromonospora sp. CPCC 205561 TaxID=3122407 RepID=UPI002FF35FFD
MATAKKPGGQPASPWLGVAVLGALVVTCGICAVGSNLGDDDGGTAVPPPTTTQRADTVPLLARAAESQGICYGWQLEGRYSKVVNVGSNLGDGISVEDNPACPRWIRITGEVIYTSQSSESDDYAYVTVDGSDDFRRTDLRGVEQNLERFGLTDKVFIDDPGWAVTRAAVSLPLLVAERGLADPAPVSTADPATPPAALPEAGSDFWRDRWGYVLAVAGLLLVTALLFAAGFWQRGRQRRKEAEGQGRTGQVRAAGRTPEGR